MSRDDHYEPNRVFGMPWGPGSQGKEGEEPQRVMGIPREWIGPVDNAWLRSLAHTVRGYRRWPRRRRFGPYAPDDEPAKG